MQGTMLHTTGGKTFLRDSQPSPIGKADTDRDEDPTVAIDIDSYDIKL